ncbi:hypothetical protein IKE67_02990 [bacterium]|nr:hypothetical protein [bacterium]
MQIKILDKITIIYLILPMIIFLVGWLNPIYALISCAALIYVVSQVFKSLLKRKLEITKVQLISLVTIALVWCILAGIGGLYYQSPDWHIRNAVFRDLINFSYPVIYDNGAALVYYFGMFLPGAVVGKIALYLHAAPETAFNIGNWFNLIYSSTGISLVFLQTLILTNAKKKQLFLVLFLFIFFSGLDILYGSKNNFSLLHIEVHHGFLEYSSNTTLLFWVYNQTIAPWLVTALFLRRPFNMSNYGFLGVLGLFSAPLPFIGLGIYMSLMTVVRFVRQFIKQHLKIFLKDLFSIRNILSILILMPVFYFFYASNVTSKEDPIFFLNLPLMTVKFVLIEVGVYLICIFYKNIKNPIYYATVISLFVCPFLFIPDLSMRVSIPALFTLFVLVIKYLFSNKISKILKTVISIALLFGMVTPTIEFYRGYHLIYMNSKNLLLKDNIKTLNNKIEKNTKRIKIETGENLQNFVIYKNYGAVDLNKQIFFKYLAKKTRK